MFNNSSVPVLPQFYSSCISKAVDDSLKFRAFRIAFCFFVSSVKRLILLPYLEPVSTGVELGVIVSELPKEFFLLQNHPNPYFPTTKITYKLPKAEQVSLSIYNLLGQKIVVLINEQRDVRRHTDHLYKGKDSKFIE